MDSAIPEHSNYKSSSPARSIPSKTSESPQERKKGSKKIHKQKIITESEKLTSDLSIPKKSNSRSPSPGKSTSYTTTPKKTPEEKDDSTKTSESPKIKTEPPDEPSTSSQFEAAAPYLEDFEDTNNTISTENESEVPLPAPSVKKRRKKHVAWPGGHKCEFCGRTYKYRKGMLQHQRLECNQEPQFPCPYCPLKFRYRHQIRNHVHGEHNQAFARWYSMFYQSSKLSRKRKTD